MLPVKAALWATATASPPARPEALATRPTTALQTTCSITSISPVASASTTSPATPIYSARSHQHCRYWGGIYTLFSASALSTHHRHFRPKPKGTGGGSHPLYPGEHRGHQLCADRPKLQRCERGRCHGQYARSCPRE